MPTSGEKSFNQRSRVESVGHGGFLIFDIHGREDHHVLSWPHSQEDFGVLDTQSSNLLRSTSDVESVRFTALVEVAVLSKRKKGNTSKPKPISISINVYGPESVAEDVGRRFSDSSAFLQHPKSLSQGIRYQNPHFLEYSEDESDMSALIGVTNDSPSARRARISDEISSILDCLTDAPGSMDIDYNHPKGLLSQLEP